MELIDKVALITGSTSGIGRETAVLMATAGAEIVVSGRDTARGEATVQSIVDGGGKARFVQADLADLDSLRHLADEAGDVDILVNNAAIAAPSPSMQQDVASFEAAFAVNVRAPYFLTAALAPAMIAKGSGSIVNVSTMVARIAMPGMSVYSATKAALESLTRAWAAEFSPAGVRVNTVAPGPTRTEMVARMSEEVVEQIAKTTLLSRVASAREIAEVILFLASDRASYVTGTVVATDAGRTAI
jgi:NAD(P)-dependent dehydrogenase (short-subunit alcohol dehydrogenase family)